MATASPPPACRLPHRAPRKPRRPSAKGAPKAATRGKVVGILSRKRSLYTTGRLIAAARQRGHRARVIDVLRCTLSLGKNAPSILYEGAPVGAFVG